ncbi:MAG: allophanate hydrolase subunit 2 family protein, partial [Gammaproteobacteria bacterium]|nr:allophanate hydrolase subunit 2 family protein [Gammaproteobacteria bacterium]
MSLLITHPGLQTTIQARPRTGIRHMGVPSCGPADSLSMALANHLVGNSPFTPALEATLSGIQLTFESNAWFAVTGATSASSLNGQAIPFHKTLPATAGDRLTIGSASSGVRTYIGFAGGLVAEEALGSASTYLPAAMGGHAGRALKQGDRLVLVDPGAAPRLLETPARFRPLTSGPWAMRACVSAEFAALDAAGQA